MAKKKITANSTSTPNANFCWSLKPIAILMAIFGQEIRIDNSRKHRKFCSVLIFIVGIAILLINITISTMSFRKVAIIYRSKNIPTYINYLIGHAIDDLMVIGLPLSFMATRIFTRRWQELLSSMALIQSKMNLSMELHKKIRTFTFFSIFFFVSVSKQLFKQLLIEV